MSDSIEKVQADYEHFLCYSGLSDSPLIKYAYFHGADIGLDRPIKDIEAFNNSPPVKDLK
mgnify:CR=1 FL=1